LESDRPRGAKQVRLGRGIQGLNSQGSMAGSSRGLAGKTSIGFSGAKVVHTEKRPDKEEWWKQASSVTDQARSLTGARPEWSLGPPHYLDTFQTMSVGSWKETFARSNDPAASAIRGLSADNSAGSAIRFPHERISYSIVAEGWEGPLLDASGGRPQASHAFPRSNPRDEVWAHFGARARVNPRPSHAKTLAGRVNRSLPFERVG